MIRDIEAARRRYQPPTEPLISSLPDLGESLYNSAIELARNCTLERVDLMLARIQGAETALIHLRKALISDQRTRGENEN